MLTDIQKQRLKQVTWYFTPEEMEKAGESAMRHGFFDASEYKESDLWQEKREEMKQKLPYVCFVCDAPKSLALHHKTYERCCEETVDDVCWLCNYCHFRSHRNITSYSKWRVAYYEKNVPVPPPFVPTDSWRVETFPLGLWVKLLRLTDKLGYDYNTDGDKSYWTLLERMMGYAELHPDIFSLTVLDGNSLRDS